MKKGNDPLSKCIGGGAGFDGNILISNCSFETDANWDVEWHQMFGNESAKINIIVYGCSFCKGICLDSVPNDNYSVLFCKNNLYQDISISKDWSELSNPCFALEFGDEVSLIIVKEGDAINSIGVIEK